MKSKLQLLGESVITILDRLESLCNLATSLEDISEKIGTNLNIARTSLVDCKEIIDASLLSHEKNDQGIEFKEYYNADLVKEEEKILDIQEDVEYILDTPQVSIRITTEEDEIKAETEELFTKLNDDYNDSETNDDKRPKSNIKKERKEQKSSKSKANKVLLVERTSDKTAETFLAFINESNTDLKLQLPDIIQAFDTQDFSSFIYFNIKSNCDVLNSFNCSICDNSYISKDETLKHVTNIHFPRERCAQCGLELYKFELDDHANEVHKIKCNFCNQMFNEHQLMAHHRVCKLEQGLQCATCGRTYATKAKLKLHMEKHQVPLSLSCDLCDKMFRTKTELASHKKIAHSGNTFPCHECGKEFSRKTYLQKHVRHVHENHHNLECTECGKVFNNVLKLNRHMVLHTIPATIPCDICNKKYREQKDLNHHKKMVHSDTIETCSICGSTYKNKSHLADHMRTHSAIKNHTCDKCGKGFSAPKILKAHIEQFHAEENLFSCHLCEKTFKFKSSCYQHVRAHEGILSCTCEECGKSFSMKSNLRKHMRRVHKIFPKTKAHSVLDVQS